MYNFEQIHNNQIFFKKYEIFVFMYVKRTKVNELNNERISEVN